VWIAIGCPGIDHDTAEFARETGSIVSRKASHPSQALSAEAVIGQIAKHLGGDA
jgi:formylmethanofuran dehydrogenase subunit B